MSLMSLVQRPQLFKVLELCVHVCVCTCVCVRARLPDCLSVSCFCLCHDLLLTHPLPPCVRCPLTFGCAPHHPVDPAGAQAAVAGAPVTDWRGYDTGYTERYMGKPQDEKEVCYCAAAQRTRGCACALGGPCCALTVWRGWFTFADACANVFSLSLSLSFFLPFLLVFKLI